MLIWCSPREPIELIVRFRGEQCQLIGYGAKGRIIARLVVPWQNIWFGRASPAECQQFLKATGLTRTESVLTIPTGTWSPGGGEEPDAGSADPHHEES